MTNRDVLIAGAGVAGPALAYWLRRYGFHPVVVEQASALRTGGYKVDVRGAAVEVLKRMGLFEAISNRSWARRSHVSTSGNTAASVAHTDRSVRLSTL